MVDTESTTSASAKPKQPPKPPPLYAQTLFGFCEIGTSLTRTGLPTPNNSPQSFHDRCPGLVKQDGAPHIVFCNCKHSDCHVAGVKCRRCGTRRPLLATPGRVPPGFPVADPDTPTLSCIDPTTGGCVDRVACVEIEAQRSRDSDLARQLRETRAATRRPNMTDTDTSPKTPRTPRVKSGTCDHCGAPTNGGKFAPGHDAKLKGQLAAVYLNRDAAQKDRVDALAEALGRNWVKITSGHDLPRLTAGLKDDADKTKAITVWDGTILPAAQQKLANEGGEKLLARRSQARAAQAA